MTRVLFTGPGFKDLEGLQPDVRERVKSKLRDAREDPERFLRPLRGASLHALRVGDHRVLVDWVREGDVVYVHAVGHRRNVYDREL